MELLQVLKTYNKCILRENAKLKSIYSKLLKECGDTTTDDISECDGKPAKKFFEDKECDENDNDQPKDIMSEDDFFKPVTGNTSGDDREMTAAEFFGEDDTSDIDEDNASEDDVSEVEMMTAAEFFGKGQVDEENDLEDGEPVSEENDIEEDNELEDDKPVNEKDDIEEDNELEDGEPVSEENDIEEDDELNESLNKYQKANYRLFKN